MHYMQTIISKAQTLIEALPYIQKFAGKTVVIKYGGNAMINDELKTNVIEDVTLLKFIGINPVLVHGGGPDISAMLEQLAIPSHFERGLRVTDSATMNVAQMVLIGKTNKEIVSRLNRQGARAIGLSGIDGNLIECQKLTEDDEGRPIDVGQVGRITKINHTLLAKLAEDEYIPVVAPIGVGPNGESYNINADTVAGEIAAALQAEKLLMLSDVPGVMRTAADGSPKVIPQLNETDIHQLITEGVIAGGMIPKVLGCLETVRRGVSRAHILDGRMPHCLLLEIFTNRGIGTMITLDHQEHSSEAVILN